MEERHSKFKHVLQAIIQKKAGFALFLNQPKKRPPNDREALQDRNKNKD
jgi:hypothetical protein